MKKINPSILLAAILPLQSSLFAYAPCGTTPTVGPVPSISVTGENSTPTQASECMPCPTTSYSACTTSGWEKVTPPEKGYQSKGKKSKPSLTKDKSDAWASWLTSALEQDEIVRKEFDLWTAIAGSRPQLSVQTSSLITPCMNAGFPAGLSLGQTSSLVVFVKPSTSDDQTSYASFMLNTRAALEGAYKNLSRDYYKLGVAHLRRELLGNKQEVLAELKEINRDAANLGDGSWAGVIYLDALLEDIYRSTQQNNLEIQVLEHKFQGSPLLRDLKNGNLTIWSSDDFWSFFPKVPGQVAEGSQVSPMQVNQMLQQYAKAAAVGETSRSTRMLQGVIDQLESEAYATDADMAAGDEIVATAMLKELDARLEYLDSLIPAFDGTQVVFSKGSEDAGKAKEIATVPTQGCYSSGKWLGITAVGAFLLGLWYYHRRNCCPIVKGGGPDDSSSNLAEPNPSSTSPSEEEIKSNS